MSTHQPKDGNVVYDGADAFIEPADVISRKHAEGFTSTGQGSSDSELADTGDATIHVDGSAAAARQWRWSNLLGVERVNNINYR